MPSHPLTHLSPTDTTFAELEFLRSELDGARVVFLAEPTHGEGNVLAAKIRLVAYLQQRLGFTTLAMESGFFSLHKAQQEIATGKSVAKNMRASVFPVWMQTREFQAVLPLVGPEGGGLRLMGFDPQLSGDYSDDLADDLEDFLEPEKGAKLLNYGLLDDVAGYMEAHFAFPPSATLGAYEAELAKAAPLLAHAGAAPQASRRAEAAFWQQCLRSLAALARDYAQHDPSAKIATTFVAADSNPRDAQMADNLLWYLRQHPAEKVICWGALPHFAGRVEALQNDELRDFRPMGRAVKAALGPDQVYTLGTLAGGGSHGLVGTAGEPVPEPAPGTLEASLLATSTTPYAFVSLKHDAAGRQLTTYAFDYQPLAGPWSEVVDGFLFFKTVEPPHLLPADSTATPPDSTARALAAAAPGSLSPAPGQSSTVLRRAVGAANVSGVRLVRGVVLDRRTRQPVPYASVALPGLEQGTVADGQGRFGLALPGPTPLRVTSLGYAPAEARSPAGNEELTVLLAPAAYALDEVRVAARPLPTAEGILKNVVKRIPLNYEQQDYAAEVYTYQRVTSYDTVRLEQEQVSRLRVPAGFHDFTRGFLMHEDGIKQQVQERHLLRPQGNDSLRFMVGARYGNPQGYLLSAADPVRTAPLFKARGARRFQLKLDSVRYRSADTLYVLNFVARQADHRSTGTYLAGVYQGRVLVRARDYAVLRYEALWQLDTATYNSVARKNYGHSTIEAKLYASVFSADRTTHVVAYAKAATGRYYVQRSVGNTASAGRSLGKNPFNQQVLTANYFSILPTAGPPPPQSKNQLPTPLPPYRPEFWAGYKRPALE
ncbi:MAG: erythromycin esterase family protein [Janthinobacterium lividum]